MVEYEATTVAIDRPGDVALLKIQAGAPLPFLPLADKSEPAEDDTVVGLAIPDGSSQRIQSWVAKVTGRNHSHNPGDRHFFIDYLIKPGYSGGPVCNLRGEVLGQAAALVSIKHPNIASEIPGRTSVSYADKASAVARPLRQRPALEGRPSLEWVNRQGWRILAPVPRVLADLGVEEGDLIVWATTRRADRYSVEDDRIGCVWDEKKPGLYSVSMGKDFLSKAMEDAGVGGWLLLRLARGEESRVAQVRLQGT